MLEVKDREERRLKKAKVSLMRNPIFAMYSGLMMVGSTRLVEDLPTACTNGRDELYGREFIKGLTDKELCFVILHENLHKAFRHMTTWRKLWDICPQTTNAACDFVINIIAVDSDPKEVFIAMPRKNGEVYGCYNNKYRGLHVKQVFDMLREEQKDKPQGGEGGEGEGEGQPQGFDEHDWEGAKEMSAKEVEELVREVDRALRQGQMAAAKIAGRGNGHGNRAIGELLRPKVDWRAELREFMTSVCRSLDSSSWRRVNRRFLAQDIYMPTLIGESMGEILIAVDTSGSISQKEITRFLTEAYSICTTVKPEKVHLWYWGSSVVRKEEYSQSELPNLVRSTKVADGGGTTPACIPPEILKDKLAPECIVVLTDGEVPDWGSQWQSPLIWVVNDNPSRPVATHGKTIHVEEE